ncbi:E3 ubiquitin-protein ligase RNF126-A [Drosophila serrata]|uniref:E3 ubiquitin-protein ligase RNF126-A n=1 Tax=Drosophila serrata TaxID=7274 RepID=UPI000A1CFBCE|nr:E3 ubiquitin-protein ligase RNF126-A [Drosophila serrata]
MSSNNVICTICAERYRNSDNIHAGSCGHVFHEECLFRWREQSRTCPICRSENAAYFQLYLSFDSSSPSNSASSSSSSNHNDSSSSSNSNNSSNSSSNSSSSSTTSKDLSSGLMREYELLLYEKDLYQQEIKYLNHRIGQLTLNNSACRLSESDSDTDSD